MPRPTWIRRLPSYRIYGAAPWDRRQVGPYAQSVVIVGTAFAVRWASDSMLPQGIPFITFFPAVIITAFAQGFWPSVVSAAAGLLLSWYFFIPPFFSFEVEAGGILALVFYLFIVIVVIILIHLAIGAIRDADSAMRQKEELVNFQELLIGELDHRIKNIFTVMASLVKLSARYADSTTDMADDVSARILALGRSHHSLWRADRDSDATVQSIARQVLEPFLAAHTGRILITGRSPAIDVRLVQILSLIFHELATNAVKYGALAPNGGQVMISTPEGGSQTISVVWKEDGIAIQDNGGNRGYGTELIERLISGAGGQLTRVVKGNTLTVSLQFSVA